MRFFITDQITDGRQPGKIFPEPGFKAFPIIHVFRVEAYRVKSFGPCQEHGPLIMKPLRYYGKARLSENFSASYNRVYGALAPRSPLRPVLVTRVEKEAGRLAGREKADKLKKKVNSWAACLARIFEVFPLLCPDCNLEMKPVAVILNDKEFVRLLTHLGLPAEFPKFRPAPQASLYEHVCGPSSFAPWLSPGASKGRGPAKLLSSEADPPDEDSQLDPRFDYDAIEPAPADD